MSVPPSPQSAAGPTAGGGAVVATSPAVATVLGAGAADGWPNPWCRCASCAAAAADGPPRTPSALLIDGDVLVDCGAAAGAAALRAGTGLSAVSTVLLTHAHPDHTDTEPLRWRTWAHGAPPLHVAGPPAALRRYLAPVPGAWPGGPDGGPTATATSPSGPPGPGAPGGSLRVTTVGPGQQVDLGAGRSARALAAAHPARTGPPVLYEVSWPGGARLLYACDTGPLPDSTLAAVQETARAAGPLAALVLECSGTSSPDHHDLPRFAATVTQLRALGVLGPHSAVLASHAGHDNPAPAQMRAVLAGCGAALAADGTTLHLSAGAAWVSPPRAAGVQPAAAPCGSDDSSGDASPDGRGGGDNGGSDGAGDPPAPGALRGASDRRRRVAATRTLVTGGTRSGKSEYAEALLASAPAVLYLATGPEPDTAGDGWAARVQAHQLRRPDHWTTVATADPERLTELLTRPGPPVLLDGVGTFLAAHFRPDTAPDAARSAADALAAAWARAQRPVIAVTDEVGSGVHPDSAVGRRFIDELGRLNRALASTADTVVLVVAGRPLTLGAAAPTAATPTTDPADGAAARGARGLA